MVSKSRKGLYTSLSISTMILLLAVFLFIFSSFSPELAKTPLSLKLLYLVILVLLSSIVIDLSTLIFVNIYFFYERTFEGKDSRKYEAGKFKVSIIIPAYNEENNIEKTITHAFNQTQQPSKVIVIDDNSKDRTFEICTKLKEKYPNLKIIRQTQNMGKAYNITYVLSKFPLEELTIVLDADTFIARNYIEEITKPFTDKKVAISTGVSTPVKSPNFQGEILYYGSIFQYLFFCFRKQAQSYRNAITVVCGDSATYRTSFLKEMKGFPQGTVTEDMDITWRALEKGNKLVFCKYAKANSQDASTFKGSWKQITRWYKGGFQCLVVHNKELLKAKPLLFTSLLPTYIDSIVYSFFFLMSIPGLYFFPAFARGFFVADFIFTAIAIIYIDWKFFFHIVEIYFIKLFWSLAFFFALAKTAYEVALGRRNWSGKWDRDFYMKKKNPEVKAK